MQRILLKGRQKATTFDSDGRVEDVRFVFLGVDLDTRRLTGREVTEQEYSSYAPDRVYTSS